MMLRIGAAVLIMFFCYGGLEAAELDRQVCSQGEAKQGGYWFHGTEAIMGTPINVELWAEDEASACEAIAAVMTEMHRIDAVMSPYIDSSLLSRLNREAAHEFVPVGDELFSLLSASQGYSILTGGAFDITYASVGRYYDYRNKQKPDEATIEDAVKSINYRNLELNYRTRSVRFHNDHVYVDLGGIAKGHAVDKGIDILRGRGFKQAMVSAGGDSRIIGDRLGEPWVVGIRHPRQKGASVAVLPLMDVSVSTSGDYERFFEKDGVRYHHIIDRVTGVSAREVTSVTIIGPEATATDALSTSVFVLGVKKGLELINRLSGLDAIIIDGAGKMHMSRSLMQMSDELDVAEAH